jgi:hypothetical protein
MITLFKFHATTEAKKVADELAPADNLLRFSKELKQCQRPEFFRFRYTYGGAI